jgi:hypothetical protein
MDDESIGSTQWLIKTKVGEACGNYRNGLGLDIHKTTNTEVLRLVVKDVKRISETTIVLDT